jgi:tellurite resistance protein TerC
MVVGEVWFWFTLVVLALLAVDLGLFHRKAHVVPLKEAAIWTAVWFSLAMSFNLAMLLWQGPEKALEFFTGYVVELSLSVDNMFVFALIFNYFGVPSPYHHRVLFWGILGALIMRAGFIAAGTALLENFQWAFFLFGAFLIFTGIRLAFQRHESVNIERNLLVRLVRRLFPISSQYEGQHFFVRRGGKLLATPLLLVLVAVESTDLIFAIDSVPAVFAVTRDPFIVYTSNVFAILGLRSLYFLLAGVLYKFHYLKLALAGVLTFVGIKMVVEDFYHIDILVSLLVILIFLGTAMLASWIRARRLPAQTQALNIPDP